MRYLPDDPLPPYSYVPGGKYPHPVRDPSGHSHGARPIAHDAELQLGPRSPLYLRGIDLFNHGFYWEAHESWEALWIASGRQGIQADFLKGLIKLAAAGVKAREGRVAGVRRHALRAQQLFQQVLSRLKVEDGAVFRLNLTALLGYAAALEENAEALVHVSESPALVVLPFRLELIA